MKFNEHLLLKPAKKTLKVHTKLDDQIGVAQIYPGMSRAWFVSQLNCKGLKALVLQTFGSGNAPSQGWFLEELQKAINKGLIVVNISQCPGGMVEQGRYVTSSRLAAMGVIGGADLTVEAAATKLMFLLGNEKSAPKVKSLMTKSLRGEMTV